jgi:hypothetical protein
LKEERRALLDDNDSLNVKIHDMYSENEELRKSTQFMDFLHGTDGLGYAGEEEERVR